MTGPYVAAIDHFCGLAGVLVRQGEKVCEICEDAERSDEDD